MPCEHKFIHDLDLSYVNDLGYKPETLIIGTFNPSWPEQNQAEWFYGRTHDDHGNPSNRFWHVLPVLYGQEPLMEAGPDEWKAFCKDHRIAITDMIKCIDDAVETDLQHQKVLASFSDKGIEDHFERHVPNPLVPLLEHFPSIQHVYVTRATTYLGLWRDLTQGIKTACLQTDRTYSDLLTPSPYARHQMGRWNRAHPNELVTTIEELLENRWVEVWHAHG